MAPLTERPASVLFVCTGNTCRSPLAEAVARAQGMHAASAGTDADAGSCATPQAQTVAAAAGLDVGDHRSRLVAEEDVALADSVLTMTDAQADAIRLRWPSYADKVSRLDPDRDIDDPFGHPTPAYAAMLEHVSAAVRQRIE